jgi:hypothetical protein
MKMINQFDSDENGQPIRSAWETRTPQDDHNRRTSSDFKCCWWKCQVMCNCQDELIRRK